MKRRNLHRREFVKAVALSVLAFANTHVARGAERATNVSHGADPYPFKDLAGKLHGRIITPADHEYDTARRVWNFRFNRHPAAIIQCADNDDVGRCVDFARRYHLTAAVRSGGHSQAGLSVCDDGFVIDLSRMKKIEIDPVRRIARAEPGLTRVEFERATQKYGLATAMGQCQDVGLGGLVLGGGEGVLAGRYGAACDNVLEAKIVLADGRVLQPSRSENPDLLWGVCGGAGNLGVVTRMDFQLYPLREAVAGWLWYPFSQARGVLSSYRDFTRSVPDTLWTELSVQRPDDRDVMVGVFIFDSDPVNAERNLSRVRKLGRAVRESIKRQPYLDAQAAAGFPVWWGWSSYQRSGFIPRLTDELLDAIAATPPAQSADLWFAHLPERSAAGRRISTHIISATPASPSGPKPTGRARSRARPSHGSIKSGRSRAPRPTESM